MVKLENQSETSTAVLRRQSDFKPSMGVESSTIKENDKFLVRIPDVVA